MKLKTTILALVLAMSIVITPLLAAPVTKDTTFTIDTRYSTELNLLDYLGNPIFVDKLVGYSVSSPYGGVSGDDTNTRILVEHASLRNFMNPNKSDTVTVKVNVPGFKPYQYSYNLREETVTHRVLDIKLDQESKGITLEGRVILNEEISPNTKVELCKRDAINSQKKIILLPVNQDGTYKIDALTPAEYTLTAVKIDEKGEMAHILSESKVVNINLDTIVDLEAQATTQLHVRVINTPNDFSGILNIGTGGFNYTQTTNAKSKLVMRNVEKGKQRIGLTLWMGTRKSRKSEKIPSTIVDIQEGINTLTYDMKAEMWEMTYGEVIPLVDEEESMETPVIVVIPLAVEGKVEAPSKPVAPITGAPQIIVNGTKLSVSAVNKDNRVLVPLRAIFEALGVKVDYDAPTKIITGTQGDTRVVLTVNKKAAYVNNTKILLDVPAQIIQASTLVPVRFIGESLGAKVEWKNNTVIVNSN